MDTDLGQQDVAEPLGQMWRYALRHKTTHHVNENTCSPVAGEVVCAETGLQIPHLDGTVSTGCGHKPVRCVYVRAPSTRQVT